MIHVRRPAFCVPIVTFRLDRPAHVWAAVIAVTPHCVRPWKKLAKFSAEFLSRSFYLPGRPCTVCESVNEPRGDVTMHGLYYSS